MAEHTNISWADSSLNIWEGCQETGSPACVGCYARERNLRYAPKGTTQAPNWGPHAPRREVKSWRANLRKISRLALAAGRPWFVFVNSLSDFWDNQADPALRAEALAEFAKHPHLTFLLLTKRPQNIVKMFRSITEVDGVDCPDALLHQLWPRNVAIGCTVVTQKEAERDVLHLLTAKALLHPAFAFLSLEPMVEAIDLTKLNLWPNSTNARYNALAGMTTYAHLNHKGGMLGHKIDWVIAGGMSSQGKHQAVPCDPDAFVDMQIQCEEHDVAFHFKQWGDWIPDTPKKISQMEGDPKWRKVGLSWMHKVGTKAAGRCLLGKIHDARPTVSA